ncbi:DUF397 domain-containing protein [Streptomyces sp. NPDC101175]|uniref:DUF397 domain-containing protein n=1 Tax=Streptomyces sp. NPDC101175 TaxID=3366123 RepID=UPI003836D01D
MRRSTASTHSWRKSSCSGPGDDDSCIEIATTPTHISVRDSKTPARATLTLRPTPFSAFVTALKTTPYPTF